MGLPEPSGTCGPSGRYAGSEDGLPLLLRRRLQASQIHTADIFGRGDEKKMQREYDCYRTEEQESQPIVTRKGQNVAGYSVGPFYLDNVWYPWCRAMW